MKTLVKNRLLFLGLLIITSSCNKVEKTVPRHFAEKPNWSFTELTIGYDKIESHPNWEIQYQPDQNGYMDGTWFHASGSKSYFNWKFSTNYSKFEFKVKPLQYNEKESPAYYQCYNLSGTYTVITNKKGLFEFESNQTNGYIGPRIYIKIE